MKCLLQFGIVATALLVCGCSGTDGRTERLPDAPSPAAQPRADPPAVGGMGATTPLLQDDSTEDPRAARLSKLTAAVETSPNDAEARRRLGSALRSVGRTEEAIEQLERATELDPDGTNILLGLGTAYSGAGRFDDAEAAYLRIVENSPDHSRALNNLGNIALRRGDEDGAAVTWYRRAVEADPEYLGAKHKLAEALKYYGHFDEAYPVYESILEMRPTGPREQTILLNSLYSLGSINLAWSKHDLAEKQLTRVVQLAPNHRSAHYALAQVLTQLGRDEDAQRELAIHTRVLQAGGEGF